MTTGLPARMVTLGFGEMEDMSMVHEGVPSRMGRRIAGVANAAIGEAEDTNKVAAAGCRRASPPSAMSCRAEARNA